MFLDKLCGLHDYMLLNCMTLQLLTYHSLTDCFQVFARIINTLVNILLWHYTLHTLSDPDFSWLLGDLLGRRGFVALSTLWRKKKVTLLLRFTLAFRLRSSDTMSTWPSWAARWTEAIPCRVTAFASAPYSSRVVAMSIWFFLAAMCSGV